MSLVQAPDDQWPKAWLMRSNVTEPCSENKMDLDEPVLAADLKRIGISYWHMKDTEKFEYPIKAVPWDPNDAMDPELEQLRSDRGYSYADIITIHPNHLPDFETKIASFFEEHIHDAEEIRYILGGSGFFDVRDGRDNWVRIHVKRGDLITLPEGMYHSTSLSYTLKYLLLRLRLLFECFF
jgi:1,2-dihydroxy-3-keto-5-methylthiopentene dioxygenase